MEHNNMFIAVLTEIDTTLYMYMYYLLLQTYLQASKNLQLDYSLKTKRNSFLFFSGGI